MLKKAALGLLVILTAILGTVTLAPLLETNAWWVRYLDFVRLQVMIVLVTILAVAILLRASRSTTGAAALVACALAIVYQAYQLYPYLPTTEPMAAQAVTCPVGSSFKLMVSNVKKGNQNFEAFRRVVEQADPDILLALETDQWWNAKLEVFHDRYPASVASLPKAAEYYGLHLLSKFPLSNASIKFYFGSKTPTVKADFELPTGSFTFVGLHPRPPQSFGRPTTLRDGAMAQAAFSAFEAKLPTVVAGDFNAVSWEGIFRRMMRVGGLLDPSVGRGFFATYDASSPILAWPLDHILFQDAIGLADFEKLPFIDSDHYPIMATLCLSPVIAAKQSAPAASEHDREELRRAIRSARAFEQ